MRSSWYRPVPDDRVNRQDSKGPHTLTTPPIGLIPILAASPVIDIDVNGFRRTLIVVRGGCTAGLVEALSLERPADHLAVTAASEILRKPITLILADQRG